MRRAGSGRGARPGAGVGGRGRAGVGGGAGECRGRAEGQGRASCGAGAPEGLVGTARVPARGCPALCAARQGRWRWEGDLLPRPLTIGGFALPWRRCPHAGAARGPLRREVTRAVSGLGPGMLPADPGRAERARDGRTPRDPLRPGGGDAAAPQTLQRARPRGTGARRKELRGGGT